MEEIRKQKKKKKKTKENRKRAPGKPLGPAPESARGPSRSFSNRYL
jgi:hypothetical protein